MNRLDHWSGVESRSRAELRTLQEEKLRLQLTALYRRSPFYQRKFEAAGAVPEDIRMLEDLAGFPFTEKQELRDSQRACPPLGEHAGALLVDIERVHATSGTTGTPCYVGVTARDSALWREAVARAYYSQGVRRESVVVIGFGIGFFVGGIPVKQALAAIGATTVPVGTGATDRLIDTLIDLQADVLTCTPSYARHIAEHLLARRGIEPSDLGLRRVLVGAEPGGGIPAVRAALQETWKATVTESVGNGDVIPIHSGECEAQDGNHFLVPDMVLAEVVEPSSGAVLDVDRGLTRGELVLTHLDRQCGALVRFRTRDHVEVRSDPCPCGRTGPRMVCLGRTDDMLLVQGVNVWPSAVKDIVGGFAPRVTGELRIALDREGHHLDPPLHVVVEVNDRAAIEPGEIERELRGRIVASCSVSFVAAGTFPRTQTKEKLLWRRDLDPDPNSAGA
ncbi:MAG: hypothetical protein OXB92_00035 [Acidimicrobiaceae bacterium]|nr:phenylacetate--CoA ligase family protein [Acidimicrobiia bacterium]MCY4492229.1 hypothetical protein [Acidimicrobiaceae bacterium]